MTASPVCNDSDQYPTGCDIHHAQDGRGVVELPTVADDAAVGGETARRAVPAGRCGQAAGPTWGGWTEYTSLNTRITISALYTLHSCTTGLVSLFNRKL